MSESKTHQSNKMYIALDSNVEEISVVTILPMDLSAAVGRLPMDLSTIANNLPFALSAD